MPFTKEELQNFKKIARNEHLTDEELFPLPQEFSQKHRPMEERVKNLKEEMLSKYSEFIHTWIWFEKVFPLIITNPPQLNSSELQNIKNTLGEKANQALTIVGKADPRKTPRELIEELDRLSWNNQLMLSVCAALKQRGEKISWQEFKGLSFECTESSQVSSEDQSGMIEIYMRNYAHNPELRDKLINDFKEVLAGNRTRIYMMKKDGIVIGFIRFDDLPDGSAHGASFNVSPEFAHSSVGNIVLQEALNKEAASKIIRGECPAMDRIGAKYIEDGSVATDFIKDFYGTPILTIIRNDAQIPNQFVSKKNVSK